MNFCVGRIKAGVLLLVFAGTCCTAFAQDSLCTLTVMTDSVVLDEKVLRPMVFIDDIEFVDSPVRQTLTPGRHVVSLYRVAEIIALEEEVARGGGVDPVAAAWEPGAFHRLTLADRAQRMRRSVVVVECEQGRALTVRFQYRCSVKKKNGRCVDWYYEPVVE